MYERIGQIIKRQADNKEVSLKSQLFHDKRMYGLKYLNQT